MTGDDHADVTGRYPFGRPATRRPPRVPSGPADVFVLGVYPSALHVRWTRPDGKVVGALAVDDEPEVFWDGADAEDRIAAWQTCVGWTDAWGLAGPAGGNGSSGRVVVDKVLKPLGVTPERAYFSDCLPTYFVKTGAGSQGEAIRTVYDEFAAASGGSLRPADVPRRPTPRRLVERAVAEESGVLARQLGESGAPLIVTLGQEAADVLAGVTGSQGSALDVGPSYGERRSISIDGRAVDWLPVTHPGNRNAEWAARHKQWMTSVIGQRRPDRSLTPPVPESLSFATVNDPWCSIIRSNTMGCVTAVADTPLPGPAGSPFPRLDLAGMQAAVRRAAESDGECLSEVELIDALAQAVRLRNSLDALQASLARSFGRRHVATQTASNRVDPEKLERGVVSQVAAACRTSPYHGRKLVTVGRDLREGLDHVRALHAAGELGGRAVAVIVTATADLDADERARVDALLSSHDLAGMSVGAIRDLTRTYAAQVAPQKFRARTDTARAGRRVTVRPGEDGMCWLTAHLPVEQGVACAGALEKAWNQRQCDPAPLTRTRSQVMADTLVERVTGKSTAEHVDVQVQVVVPIEALVDPDSPLPAEIPGHGPVPVALLNSMRGRKTWRRLVTRKGIVIGGDSRQRCFPEFLELLIRARDRYRCSAPYCDAPIRQIDHITRIEDGGVTEFWDGRGVCEFCNYARELPGWTVQRTGDTVETITPTGHTYLSGPKSTS